MSQYSSNTIVDMSSYVAVTGRPELNWSSVFGLTPQELRYLKGKFHKISKNGDSSGINLHEASPLVVLNALGFIGFKVITVAGNIQEYLWTLERNLDSLPDLTYYSSDRQHHSSMYDISGSLVSYQSLSSGYTLEVPSGGKAKKGSGSCLSLVSDSGVATRCKEKKAENDKGKKGGSRRHSLSTSLNRLLHS